jgi:predicted transcriptional regulator
MNRDALPDPTPAQSLLRGLFAAGVTQQAVAQAVGVTQATVSRMASGAIADPRGSVIDRLRAFAVEVQTDA